ncbi:DUF6879 family protein [Streptomyces sp. NPDC050121]|uniref:DUF6879 family protein n=1 Tax=Streptomyces sp. NPDC050121 TaxID=3365601 RepID=UPI0037A3798F
MRALVAVAMGGMVYLLTSVIDPYGEDGPWQLVLAVLCGGITLVLQFLIFFVNELHAVKESVDRRFADIGRATKLFNEVETLRTDGVPRIAESATRVLSTGPEILHAFAHAEIDRLAGQMEDLADLSAESAGENHDWLVTLTRCARTSIDAISTTVVDAGFWSTEPAGRYLNAQRDAILERGVSVRRLCIVKQPEEFAALLEICEEQREMGVQVRVVALEDLPLHLRRSSAFDCIVFDDALSYEVRTNGLSMSTLTTVNSRADEVQPLIRRFHQLWEATEHGAWFA